MVSSAIRTTRIQRWSKGWLLSCVNLTMWPITQPRVRLLRQGFARVCQKERLQRVTVTTTIEELKQGQQTEPGNKVRSSRQIANICTTWHGWSKRWDLGCVEPALAQKKLGCGITQPKDNLLTIPVRGSLLWAPQIVVRSAWICDFVWASY